MMEIKISKTNARAIITNQTIDDMAYASIVQTIRNTPIYFLGCTFDHVNFSKRRKMFNTDNRVFTSNCRFKGSLYRQKHERIVNTIMWVLNIIVTLEVIVTLNAPTPYFVWG